jgi:hypothetical protein
MMGRIAATLIVAGLLLVPLAGTVAADEPVMTVNWSASAPSSGEVVDGNVHVSAGDAGAQLPLIAIDVPDLGRAGYAIRGRVRYADVVGSGYLEMWSVFADGGRYFSRTLGNSGPMGVLTGSSDWREFELPFYLEGSAPPARLEINVFLPSSGSVDVGPLELVRLPEAAGGTNAWLSDRSVGVVGAVLGTAIGLLGALIGVLVSRQRGRRFVLPAMTAAAVVGIALVVASVAAVPAGQPPNVVFLLFLPGAILAGAFGAAIPRVRRAYAEAELRRMRAMDQA